MATLTELRNYVRVQTETTSAELPDSTIDNYLQEAYNRTIAAENRWPFFEETWSLTQLAGDNFLEFPPTVNETAIVALKDWSNQQRRLIMIDQETAEDLFLGVVGSGSPTHYSIWGGTFYFWPSATFTYNRSFYLRGYRKPLLWINFGPSTEPDCDDRLHWPLAHYAIALAYAQQEDEVLEVSYMARWQRDVEAARAAIMEPSRHAPMTMGGGKTRSMRSGPSWSF